MKPKSIIFSIASTLLCLPILTACIQNPQIREQFSMTNEQRAMLLIDLKRRPLTQAEKAAIQPVVKEILKDPSSANFKWTPYIINPSMGFGVYCGYVNSKNSYGGYSGFQPYQVYIFQKGKTVTAQLIGISSGNYNYDDMQVLRNCARNGYLVQ